MIIKKDCLHLFCTSFDLLSQMTMPRSLLGNSIVCPLPYLTIPIFPYNLTIIYSRTQRRYHSFYVSKRAF